MPGNQVPRLPGLAASGEDAKQNESQYVDVGVRDSDFQEFSAHIPNVCEKTNKLEL